MKKLATIFLAGVLAISLTACGGNTENKKQVELSVIHEAVKEVYGEDYIPSMPYDATVLEEQFGIDPDWYTQIIAEGPMISAHVDTFIAVEAKKENVKDVEEALKKYRDKLISDTMQYPMNLPKINGSKIYTSGNYVFFIMLGVFPEDGEQTEETLLKAAEELNDIAIKAIDKAME